MNAESQSDAAHGRLEALGKLVDSIPVVILLRRIEPGHWPVEVVSVSVQALLGYSPEDFMSGRVFWPGVTHPEDVPRLEREVSALFSAGRDEWSQQYRLIARDGRTVWVEDCSRVLRDAAGKATHIQALVMDITEKNRAEVRLLETLKATTEGIWCWDFVTDPLSFSHRHYTMLGYKPDAFAATFENWLALIHPDDRASALAVSQTFLATKTDNYENEFRMRAKDGNYRWIHTGARVVQRSEDGTALFMVGNHEDITERKQVERRLAFSTEVVSVLNRPVGLRDTIDEVLAAIKSETGFDAVGIRLREGDDFPYFQTNGFPERFVQMERYLCERDAAGNIERDAQGNPVLECMCGNILCGRFDPKLPFFTEGGSFWSNCTTELLATTTEQDRQARTRNRCNGEGYESVALIPLRVGDETIGLLQFNDHRRNQFTQEMISFFESLGASIGIAFSRARISGTLRESEQRHRALVDAIPDMIFRMDRNGVFLDWKPATGVGLYVQAADFIGKNQRDVLPREVIDVTDPAIARALETGLTQTCEYNLPIDGAMRSYEARIVKVDDGEVVAVVRDITARRQADDALKKSARLLRDTGEMAKVGGWELDLSTQEVSWTEEVGRIHGVEPGYKPKLEEALKFYVPESSADVEAAVKKCEETGEPYDLECLFIPRGSKDPIWVQAIGKAVYSDGKIVRLAGTFQNIDRYKRATADLRVSLEKYRVLFESFPLGISVTDAAGNLIEANPESERLLGIPRDDHTRRKQDGPEWRIVRPDGTPMPSDEYASVRALKGKRFVGNVEMGIVKGGGEITWISVSAAPVPIEGYGVAITYGDISARKQAEEALRRSAEELRALALHLQNMREEERAALARELHDNFGQNLTALQIDLMWLDKHMQSAKPGNLATLRDKVAAMAPVVEHLTEMTQTISSSLRLGVLDDLGLVAAIEWEASEFEKRMGLPCAVALPAQDIELDPNMALATFRILQEALTNVVRHAQATRVEIRLRTVGNGLELEIQDNGEGFASESISGPKAMGVLSMRERAVVFGGTVDFLSEAGKGTTVRVRMPAPGIRSQEPR